MSSADCRVVLAAVAVALAAGATLAADLSSIVAVPQQGQSAERARRDRYECHNWAVAQTGVVPQAPDREAVDEQQRADRVERVVTGATIGAVAGSIVRGAQDHRDAADGALAGGILGAVVGAVTGRNKEPPEDEAFDAYYRALSACLVGRGYEVVIAENP